MNTGDWKYKLFFTLTYKDSRANTNFVMQAGQRPKPDTLLAYGDLDKWLQRLAGETKAHWACEAGFEPLWLEGRLNQHIHGALQSPDCSFDRWLKAWNYIERGKCWKYGSVRHLRPWNNSKRNQGIDYIRKHEVTPGLERYVYCPKQSNSCRKGRCKHKQSL